MKTESCLRYLEDPEANAGHLAECAECRALFGANGVPSKPLSLDALPLAPWEGASHRSWPLVLAGTIAAMTGAAVLCFVAGMTPLQVIEHVLSSMQQRRDAVRTLAASFGWHVVVPAFIVVNGLLIALLRRSPRGIDA